MVQRKQTATRIRQPFNTRQMRLNQTHKTKFSTTVYRQFTKEHSEQLKALAQTQTSRTATSSTRNDSR